MHIFLASWLSPSRTFLERIVPRLDLAIKLTVLVAALLGLAYWRYSKQLQQFTKQELDKEREESEMGRLQMQSDIARANESTAKLEAEAEKLRGKNLELQDKLEKEHSERIELEKEVAPRSARIDVSKLGESLKQYAGVLYATRTIM